MRLTLTRATTQVTRGQLSGCALPYVVRQGVPVAFYAHPDDQGFVPPAPGMVVVDVMDDKVYAIDAEGEPWFTGMKLSPRGTESLG